MALLDGISLWDAVLAVVVLLVLWAAAGPRLRARRFRRRRRALLHRLEEVLGGKVLTMVHGKGPLSFFGRPVYNIIDMDDAEEVLRGIRAAGDRPVTLVLHTPGGMYHAALQIARAMRHHKPGTKVVIPHYAMSGGTLIALAADEIIMDPDAVMGPVDPQVGDFLRGWQSAASWVHVAKEKGKEADDITLAMSDVSGKLLEGTQRAVAELIEGKVKDPGPLLERLVGGGIAHGYPMSAREMQELGLPVRTDLPKEVHQLLAMYRGPRRPPIEAS